MKATLQGYSRFIVAIDTNSIFIPFVFCFLMLTIGFTSCADKNVVEYKLPIQQQERDIQNCINGVNFEANLTNELGSNILCLFQDTKGNYWFGTQNSGVYCYNGRKKFRFTHKDGLFQNQVQSIKEDKKGRIWFSTGGFGICYFDGKKIKKITLKNRTASENINDKKRQLISSDLWFNAGAGAYYVEDTILKYLAFEENGKIDGNWLSSANRSSAYSVYSITKDKIGNCWFGTQAMGVCKYDGHSWRWFTDKGLKGPAVLAVYEDNIGNVWVGTNGSGLFCYDGNVLTNITEERGLSNPDFCKSGKPKSGSLARVWAIAEDDIGNIWLGTGEGEVWKYNRKELICYSSKHGLPNNPIETIYKDKKGQLLIGTNGGGVFKFNGANFENVRFN
jgi:ligand-binding sensor domain-containing protein